jgi:Tfp pilus assembly protein PilF
MAVLFTGATTLDPSTRGVYQERVTSPSSPASGSSRSASAGSRLESWKEIAAYLSRAERTVRRWEAEEGLPVRRLHHAKRGSVYAFTAELDRWRESRQLPDDETERLKGSRTIGVRWLAIATTALFVGGLAFWAVASQPVPPPAHTPNPEAVRALQRGRFGSDAGRIQVSTGIRYAREAVRIDPEYATAWAALAIGHVAQTWFDERPAIETMGEARKEAERAQGLGAARGGPQMVLGWVRHYLDWDHDAAEQHFREAIRRNADNAVAHSWYGDFLMSNGRFDEAARAYKASQDADPRWLEPIVLGANLSAIRGHFDVAEAEFRRALDVGPTNGLANHFYGRLLLLRGESAKAVAQLRRSDELLGQVPFSTADLGYALALDGQRRQAESLLVTLKARRDAGYYPAFAIAIVELGLGRTDAALDWLERAADERHLGFYMPSVDPVYDRVRAHPRFKALLERIRLAGQPPRSADASE